MDGPEDEEDDEEVMSIPEALEIGTSGLLCGCQSDSHQGDKHDISTPTRTSGKVSQNETHET